MAINVLAWRDLDDPEAGGSEVHIHEVMRRWSDAGVAVTMRTSFAPGQPAIAGRGGYRVIRRAGRYLVFPRAAARSEAHTSELQSLMRISYAVFCLKNKKSHNEIYI